MIKFYIPAGHGDMRAEILEKAIDIAKFKLAINAEIWPIDIATSSALMSSNLTSEMVTELYRAGYKRDEINVFFVRKDIHTEDTSFCFGASHGKTIVISDYRVWHATASQELKIAMLAFLIEHELGHTFGAADDIRRHGIYDMHCRNLCCAMQQVGSVEELASVARRVYVANSDRNCFCLHCKTRFNVRYWDTQVC